MTLSVSLRCAHDFQYYRSQSTETPAIQKLEKTVKRLISNTESLHNLLTQLDEPEARPFHYILGRTIHNDLETLHRDLLFFDADQIIDIIPLIDSERRFWREYNMDRFYNPGLIRRLGHEIPAVLKQIRHGISHLN